MPSAIRIDRRDSVDVRLEAGENLLAAHALQALERLRMVVRRVGAVEHLELRIIEEGEAGAVHLRPLKYAPL